MSIIRSDNPPHARNICTGKKTIEWTKAPLPTGKMFCYETITGGGCGMVIGEATVWASYKVEVDEISDEWLKYGMVDRAFLEQYAGGKPLYANLVEKAEQYDKPIPLSEFERPCPYHNECIFCKYHDNGGMYEPPSCNYTDVKITRPPQSWCYVEDLK